MSITFPGQTELQPHSRLGLASLILGTVGSVSFVSLLRYAGTYGGKPNDTATLMFGIAMLLIWLMVIVGTGLGIAAAVQPTPRKTFSVMGLVVNLGMLVLSSAIVAFGIWMM